MPRRGFWDARRDAASHFIRGASMAWRWTPSPRSRVFLTQVAPKEARVPAGNGVAGRAASNRDLVAAEPKEQTVAILEDDVVALPVACGEMAFRRGAQQRGHYGYVRHMRSTTSWRCRVACGEMTRHRRGVALDSSSSNGAPGPCAWN